MKPKGADNDQASGQIGWGNPGVLIDNLAQNKLVYVLTEAAQVKQTRAGDLLVLQQAGGSWGLETTWFQKQPEINEWNCVIQ